MKSQTVAEKLPDLLECIDPAISDSLVARNKMVEEFALLDLRIAEVTQCRHHKQVVSLSLAAEELARTAFNLRELALSIHRSIARRLDLEVRI